MIAHTAYSDHAAAYVSARPTETAVSTSSAMTQIQRWLDACKLHAECAPQGRKELPARLIDVGATSALDIPRLYIPDGQCGHYAALSYCWGGAQSGALKRNNLVQYCQALDLHNISQSIKDAIKVVKGVGLRYLWVDAICIIQDSDEDKVQQIAKMHEIYHNALFTISAVSASTAQDGFLNPQCKDVPTYKIPFRCQMGDLGPCLYKKKEEKSL